MALFNEQKNRQPPNELKCVFIFKCVTLCCTTNTNVAKCDSFSFHFKLKEILSSVIYDCLECNALKRNFNDYWIEKCLMRYLKVSMFDFPFLIFRVNWKRNTLTTKKRGARQLLFLSDITLSAISRFLKIYLYLEGSANFMYYFPSLPYPTESLHLSVYIYVYHLLT